MDERHIRLLRGALWRRRHPVVGGSRTELFGPVHVSAPNPNVRIELARNVRFYQGVGLYLDAPGATIRIGDGTYLNRRTELTCKELISIGDGCAISWDVVITDTDYHEISGSKAVAPVHIGDCVWIGAKAMVLKGVRIGAGAVIAAGALVTKDVPSRTLVGGNPARVLREDIDWH